MWSGRSKDAGVRKRSASVGAPRGGGVGTLVLKTAGRLGLTVLLST